jgi:hypothetical protein
MARIKTVLVCILQVLLAVVMVGPSNHFYLAIGAIEVVASRARARGAARGV